MPDNVGITPGSGAKAACREVSYSGETALVQVVGLATFDGADDAKTVADVSSANPLPTQEAGGAVTLDVLDIAGGTTGAWTGNITYDGNVNSFGAGTCGAYAPYGQEGRFTYVNVYVASQINQIYRFDCKNRVFSPYTPTDFIQSGTAAIGGRMAAYAAIDGTDKYDVVLLQSHLSTISQELIPLV